MLPDSGHAEIVPMPPIRNLAILASGNTSRELVFLVCPESSVRSANVFARRNKSAVLYYSSILFCLCPPALIVVVVVYYFWKDDHHDSKHSSSSSSSS